jgi:hypothetical protein
VAWKGYTVIFTDIFQVSLSRDLRLGVYV